MQLVITVPCSLVEPSHHTYFRDGASMVLQYGHGLFGSRAEATSNGYLTRMADDNGWIVLKSDWAGMSRYDLPNAARIFMVHMGEFPALTERVQQGFGARRLNYCVFWVC